MIFCNSVRSSDRKFQQNGFTFFELIVVSIGLAILLAIAPWVYSSFTVTPSVVLPGYVVNQKINTSLLKSDIASAVSQLETFKQKNNAYPETNNCLTTESKSNICLIPKQGTVFDYKPDIATIVENYTLYASKKGVSKTYQVTNTNTDPVIYVNPKQ